MQSATKQMMLLLVCSQKIVDLETQLLSAYGINERTNTTGEQ